jgi:hypothetical protein
MRYSQRRRTSCLGDSSFAVALRASLEERLPLAGSFEDGEGGLGGLEESALLARGCGCLAVGALLVRGSGRLE